MRHESLNRGYDNWQSVYVESAYKMPGRRSVYGQWQRMQRFNLQDNQVQAGLYHPLTNKTLLLGEASYSPEHHFSPRWSALLQAEHNLGQGWGVQLGVRQSQYTSSRSNREILTLEHYWSDYRAAYTLSLSQSSGVGPTNGHRFQVNYFYGDSNRIGVALSLGQEQENLGALGIVRSNVRSVTLLGRHRIRPGWAVSHELSWHQQGDFYTRQAVRLGLRYIF